MWILMKLFMHVICIDYACNLDASILDDKIQSISHGWTLNAIFDQINEIKKIHFHQNCIPHILIDIQ